MITGSIAVLVSLAQEAEPRIPHAWSLSLTLVLVLGDDRKGSACMYFHVDLLGIDSYFSVLYKTVLIACESNQGHLEFL